MAKRVFDTSGASQSEIDGVRGALHKAGIEFYETPRGNHGRSMWAFWVENDGDYPNARQCIEQFQSIYCKEAQLKPPGQAPNWQSIVLGCLLVVLVIWMLAMGYSR